MSAVLVQDPILNSWTSEVKVEGQYASFLKHIKFPRGNYQTDSSETETL